MPVNVSQWRMEIGNFNNSISNSLCDYVFYLSKSLMVIAYLLYAVLFKHIVKWTLVLATFNAFFRKKVNIINIYLGRILYWNILFSFTSNIWHCKCLQQLNGDIELNPSPKPLFLQKLLDLSLDSKQYYFSQLHQSLTFNGS